MSCRTNSATKLTSRPSTFNMLRLYMINHSLLVSSGIITSLTLPRTRVVLVHQSTYLPVQIIYILTMISWFVDHERVSSVAKLGTNGTRETLSIYVFGLNMSLDMWYLFRIIIAFRTLPLVFYIFEHHTLYQVIELIIKRGNHNTLKEHFYFKTG